MNESVQTNEEQWRSKLSPEQYEVLRCSATEAPFSGRYWNCHDDGVYRCAACGAELFSSETKFDSGSGWPSFTEPAVEENVGLRPDTSHGMFRTEVFCKSCDGHLGHLFDDGPPEEGGMRYCINSAALDLQRSDGP